MKLSRRSVARVLLGAPVAVAAAAVTGVGSWLGVRPARAAEDEQAPPPAATDDSTLGRFLARQEEGLTSEERRKVRKNVAQIEKTLKEVRDFTLGNDLPPSGQFRPLKSKRR
jgi:hypothetical protein